MQSHSANGVWSVAFACSPFVCFTAALLLSSNTGASALSVDSHQHSARVGVFSKLNTTQPINASRFLLMEEQIEYEFGVSRAGEDAVPTVNKLIFVLLTSFCGACGFDRCFVGSHITGVVKGLTLGGLGFWAILDFLIVMINALQMSSSINVLGLHADFKEDSITPAYFGAMACFIYHIFHIIFSSFSKTGREKVAGARDHSVARMPTLMSRALRTRGLLPYEPSVPEIKALFAKMDLDGNGLLDKSELQRGLADLGCTEEIIDKMVNQADIDGDGMINLTEFIAALQLKASA